MKKSDYVADVFRFGNAKAFVDDEKGRFNLNHKTTFTPEDVKTDGRGNIIDMPVLLRKPCFGRPEAYLRHGLYDVRKWRSKSGEELRRRMRCDPCPVGEACSKVALERIESNAEIAAKYAAFHDAAEVCPASPFGSYETILLWSDFLHEIKRHGGWSTVNDDRARLMQLQRSEHKRAKDNERRRDRRRAARLARKSQAQPITPEAKQTLADVASERLHILLRLNQWREAPRWISKLSPDRCAFTVDVWVETMFIERAGKNVTSKAIAERLICKGKDRGSRPNSLTTRVNEARKRIKRLEDNRGGAPVWPEFEWI